MIEDRFDVLVKARIATTKRRPKPAAVAKAMKPFAPTTMSDGELRDRVTAAFDRVAPLDGGLDRIDNERVAGTPWKDLVERSIPAEVLGVDHHAIKKSFAWASAIAGRALGLWSDGTPPALAVLCDALVWRELGLVGKPAKCPDAIRALFVGRQLGAVDPAKADRQLRVFAAREVHAIRADTKLLRAGLVRLWLEGKTLGASFVEDLRRVVGSMHDGVFGDRKVFIAAAWRELAKVPAWRSLTLGDFKTRVLAAHRAGALELARADAIGLMDHDLVTASECGAFHFIVRERA